MEIIKNRILHLYKNKILNYYRLLNINELNIDYYAKYYLSNNHDVNNLTNDDFNRAIVFDMNKALRHDLIDLYVECGLGFLIDEIFIVNEDYEDYNVSEIRDDLINQLEEAGFGFMIDKLFVQQ